MEFLDDLMDKAQNLTQLGVSKSKHLVEVAKLKMSSASENENIRKAYQEMGKLYFAERGMAPEPAYVALCDKVKTSRATIRHNNETLLQMKNEGVVTDGDLDDDFEDMEDVSDLEDFDVAPVAEDFETEEAEVEAPEQED